MRIDLDAAICGLDGKQFQTGEARPVLDADGNPALGANGQPKVEPVMMTVRYCLVSAFANIVQGLSLGEKVARGAMAQRLHNADRYIDLTADEVVKAKDLAAAVVHAPVVMLRLVEALDPKAVPADPALPAVRSVPVEP
jgi:hypothetical protein